MRIQWFGQSAFLLSAGDASVFIDPFDTSEYPPGIRWDYPPISGVTPDVLLITHENADHNGVAVIEGKPEILRSWGGTFETKVGSISAIVAEHDPVAGIERGPVFLYVFELGGVRICHMGDFGQLTLRAEQREAMGAVDLLLVPVGGTQTIDGAAAARIVGEIRPRWVVPMHYRTPALDVMDPVEGFLAAMDDTEVVQIAEPSVDTDELPSASGPVVVMLTPPLREDRPFVTS
jgi:L-ascorbate metabolism protein UlaG (beta-lactamase superfamily)